MVDNLKKKGPEDPLKINVNQTWELSYWSTQLGVSSSELKKIVKAVGPVARDVRAYIVKTRGGK